MNEQPVSRIECDEDSGLPEAANPNCTCKSNKVSRRRRGQSLVELSLILPVLMFICLGTIDLGRMFYGYIQMTNAVREGASVASHEPNNSGEIDAAISGHSSNLPSGYTYVTACSAGCGTAKPGDTVTITATWSFQPITFTFLDQFGLGGPISMSTHSTMKVL